MSNSAQSALVLSSVTNYLLGIPQLAAATQFGAGSSDAVKPDPTVTAFPSVNSFTLAGTLMPGKWTLMRATKKFGWQIQQGYYLSGANLFPKGDQLIVSTFRGEFWAHADFLIYRQVRKNLLAKAVQTLSLTPTAALSGVTASSLAMGIDHPELKELGCDAVVVAEVDPAIDEGGGHWTTRVEFIQFRKPLPAPPKPTQKIPDVVTPPPLPVDPAQLQIQMNQQIINTLSAKL